MMPRNRVCAFLAFAILLLAQGFSARAASVCGTVRDGATGAPVSRAACFLFDVLDRYTGLHTNTGLLGDYCIDGVAPGIYSLQIRHDAFATAVVESILVQVTVTDVDVGLEGALLLQAWPNPTTSRLHIRWELDTPSGATLEIFDIAGRRVRGWTDRSGTATRSMVWDLRDFRGRPVASGIYLVRLSTSESSNRTRRVVLMR